MAVRVVVHECVPQVVLVISVVVVFVVFVVVVAAPAAVRHACGVLCVPKVACLVLYVKLLHCPEQPSVLLGVKLEGGVRFCVKRGGEQHDIHHGARKLRCI